MFRNSSLRRLPIFLILCATGATGQDQTEAPCSDPDYRHGISYVESLKYDADFEHFSYSNPDAPKGGMIRFPALGTWDNFNGILNKGRLVAGYDLGGANALVYDRLLEGSADENASAYGRLAEGIAVEENFAWVAFKLRKNAYWHDGTPLDASDVVWTFNTYLTEGSLTLRTGLQELDRVFEFGDQEVCFVTKTDVEVSPNIPFTYGGLAILPEHYWKDHDITKTTQEPPLGSGPYKAGDLAFGKNIYYERVPDYWGRDLPVNRGRYNFEKVKFDYFLDETVMLEAHKAHVYDMREETVSKNWTTGYDFDALHAGLFRKELRYLKRAWGMWWPAFWNVRNPKFQDIRIREALFLLYDFKWINRVILFGFYDYGDSYFYNSPMAQSGLPSEDEIRLLEPFRDQIPERVYTHEFKHPPSTGYGSNRESMKRALELFDEAGWQLKRGKLRHKETNEQFHIDFVFVSAMLLRAKSPYIRRLNQAGISTSALAPEVSNWQHRMRTGKFDGGGYIWIPGNMPGFDLRNRFGSEAADQDYGLNWAGIKSPVVDYLIEQVIKARTARALYAATRALDRVLLWNFYMIPGMGQPGFRLVSWDKFGEVDPSVSGPLSRVPAIDAWWWDEEKAQRVETGIAALSDSSQASTTDSSESANP